MMAGRKELCIAYQLRNGMRRFLFSVALLSGGGLYSVHAVAAEPPVVQAAPSTEQSDPVKSERVYRYTLKELGASYPLNLRGTDSRDSVGFNIRADEVVTKATLKLNYAYSPSLISDLSHLIVLMNDQLAGTIDLPKDRSGTDLEREVNIPTRMISDFNRLSLQLIAHYTMQCEDPMHSSLWAKISNASVLEITTVPVAFQNDLSILPLPFMDRRNIEQLNLPIVFESKPDDAGLEAAGVVSSWFGALAGDRGARFPAMLGNLPAKGNAIVLSTGASSPLGLGPLSSEGPSVSVMVHPNDPNGKLLILRGRDGAELKLAAQGLTMGNQALSGQKVLIEQVEVSHPRRPYDAPNWLPSDRPVKFGELISPKNLNVSGFNPEAIRIRMQVPPDLFGWREKGAPVNLKYRYTPQTTSTNSSMIVTVNNLFVQSYILPPIGRLGDSLMRTILDDDMLPLQTRLNIPLPMLQPHSELQFKYMYDYIKQGECQDIIVDNVRGAIDPESTIDISGYSHFLAMPDLKAFSETGFPFTRLADLSDTTVVMPDAPTLQEYGAYFDVMGRMGASTGYPAVAVSVIAASKVEGAANKDLLVIATGRNNPLLKLWSSVLPVSVEGSLRFNISDLASRAWETLSFNRQEKLLGMRAEMVFKSTGQIGVFAGFESPLERKRSVVLIWGANQESLTDSVSTLLNAVDEERKISGNLSVVRNAQASTLLSEKTYTVGHLGWYKQMYWTLSNHFLAFVLLGIVCFILLSVLIFVVLKAKARKRLR